MDKARDFCSSAAPTVDELARQLDQMNVEMDTMSAPVDDQHNLVQSPLHLMVNHQSDQSQNVIEQQQHYLNENNLDTRIDDNFALYTPTDQGYVENCELMEEDSNCCAADNKNDRKDQVSNKTLIVTNVDPSVFTDQMMQATFEGLFRNYDTNVEFRFFKSFRRVRLDFSSQYSAELALNNLREYKLGGSIFKCYMAQFIETQTMNTKHLMLPKMTRQFLISPPASPPEDWEPITEGPPVIDVQLISAIANLVPGQVHEIHPGNESQPGIFVQVCEDVQYQPDKADGNLEVDSQGIDGLSLKIQSDKFRIPPTPRPM